MKNEKPLDDITLSKLKKKILLSRNIIVICNTLAGVFTFVVYYFIPEIIFMILGAILILLDIPCYFVFNNILRKIDKLKKLSSENPNTI